MGSVSSILQKRAAIVAKVVDGGYLEELVSENFAILQDVIDPDKLSDEEEIIRKQLDILEWTPVVFSAKDYVSYRPLPSALTDVKACSAKRKEFDQWIKLNRLPRVLLSHSPIHPGQPIDNLLRVASKLATDIPKDGSWIATARQIIEADEKSSYSGTLSLEDLDKLEHEEDGSMLFERYRWLFIQHTIDCAVDDNVSLRMQNEACTEMRALVSTIQSSVDGVPSEHRKKWLELWTRSLASSTGAQVEP
jgi:hypothetical protein